MSEKDQFEEIETTGSGQMSSSYMDNGAVYKNVSGMLADLDVISEEEQPEGESNESQLTTPANKSAFKFKDNNNGNIMTIHHTLNEDNKLIRVRISVCCFSRKGLSSQCVAIDKRGNVFVFDLTAKRFWKLAFLVPKASVLIPSKKQNNEYLVGTKLGQLLLLHVEKCLVVKAVEISENPITEISFAENKQHPKHIMLIHAGTEAIIFELDTFTATHRLDFDEARISLKFASFIPKTDQIFTCFTNDSVHIWSGMSLKILHKTYPIKTRNLKLRSVGDKHCQPEFRFREKCNDSHFDVEPCITEKFSDGLISAYNMTTQDGGLLGLASLDRYLTIFGSQSFEIKQSYRLRDFAIDKMAFLAHPKHSQSLILALTTEGKVALLDCQCPEFKLIIHDTAVDIVVAADGELLAVLAKTGEAEIWTVSSLVNALISQRQCMIMLKEGFKQTKPIALAPTNDCFNEDIKKLLKRDRLINILREHGCYPSKYRGLIWCALLKLPCNRVAFQNLLKLGTPQSIVTRTDKVKVKNDSLKRVLIKVWSCLAQWCKVFAYSDFLPHLIRPFVKLYPKNSLVSFEICVALIFNHFQHWFEFHPDAPADYLGMCENVLQHYDAELYDFYVSAGITAKEFAWPILSTCFAEILDETQWLMLWDNIISCPLYFPIFVVVCYNMLQREVLLLLPDKASIVEFFREKNPVMAPKLLKKSLKLMHNCPLERHPSRYFLEFRAIPKGVYPKFLRYPRDLVQKHEDDLMALKREHDAIDDRIRQLELNEMKLMAELEKGLKEEEHAKRLKDMERLYYESIKREEERVVCQRKLLLLYQKEIRGYRGQVLATLRESERRKRALELEQQMEMLLHNIDRERRKNDSAIVLAEDEIKNQNMELLAQKQRLEMQSGDTNLALKYRNDIQRLVRERSMLHQELVELNTAPIGDAPRRRSTGRFSNLDEIEKHLIDIQNEFYELADLC